MKKITRIFLLIAAMVAWGAAFSDVNAAQQYCHKTISSGTNTIYLSCETPSTGNYRITIESDVAMANLSSGCYCNINGVGGNQLINLAGYKRSSDGKKITIDIPSSSAPNLYTPLYVLMPGEVNFGTWPNDIDWTGTCTASSDVTKPVMGTATVVGSPTFNSVALNLTATDDVTSPVINYIANDATNSITNKALVTDASGNVTVTGLAASTSYNLTITAKDAAGNVSANSASISFATPAMPILTTSATAPTAPSTNVMSIFSNAYTGSAAVTNLNLNPGWGQATVQSTIKIGSDDILKYSNFNYQGTTFDHIYPVSTNMKYFHIDIWTAEETSVAVYPICWTGAANEAEKFKTIALTSADYGTWKSYDIPLTDFTSQGLTMKDVYQLKLVGSGGKTVYFDNIYFWTDVTPTLTVSTAALTVAQPAASSNTFDITTASGWTVASDQTWLTPSSTSGTGNATITLTAATANTAYAPRTANVTITGSGATKTIVVTQNPLLPASAPAPTVLASKVKSIYSDAYTPAVTVTEFSNWWDMNFSDCTFASGDNGKKVVTTEAGNCGSPTFVGTPLDVSGMTYLHVDVFPLSTMDIGLQFVTITATTANWVSLGTLTANQWNSKDIPLTLFTNAVKTDLKQVGFVTTGSFGTFYMDNLYFYKDAATGISNPVSDKGISCYPNPVKDQLNVSAKTEINQVIIRNLLGQSVKSILMNGLTRTIDLSDITSGNYFVTVKLANGQLSTQKILKL
ncbi:MAG: T9SS type A sorting domain-containing protein [Bacteroidota bacterium]|nr:T9SS type A sorting domain-containing protein [Bacteroidota bacterium]